MRDVLIVGGGMITHDQILPSIYQMQRQGRVGEIGVVALNPQAVQSLANAETLRKAFPSQKFKGYPESGGNQPSLYKEVIAAMPKHNVVVVAVPDQVHYEVVMTALRRDQHVCCVKPLVQTVKQAHEIEQLAYERGLLVGVEYHKRFDDRSLMARRRYREGMFGEFMLGTASMMEKWYYRFSNFQNWFTKENSDAFTYVGCHYVDLVHFITGLMPVAVSVYGIPDKFPNGNEGYLWSDARVLWSNGACLNVQDSLSFPDAAPGGNTQGLTMYCKGPENGAWLKHDDQFRGMQYCYTRSTGDPGSTVYAEPSPDYFQYVDLGNGGLTPVGYGYRSVDYIVSACMRAAAEPDLGKRQQMIKEYDAAGVMATPANSSFNEQVVEAGRESILNGGKLVKIET